jgi:hypothetical protein
MAAFCLFGTVGHSLFIFCFTGAETETSKIKDDSKIDREKNIDPRGLRQFGTV